MVPREDEIPDLGDGLIPYQYQPKPIGITILAILQILWASFLLLVCKVWWPHIADHGLGVDTISPILISSICLLSMGAGLGLLMDAKWSWWVTGILCCVSLPLSFFAIASSWLYFLIHLLVLVYLLKDKVKRVFLIQKSRIHAMAIMALAAVGIYLVSGLLSLLLKFLI